MIRPIFHAWHEGRQAARLADDAASARRLRSDFFWSRCLRLVRTPGYNRERSVRLAGWTLHYRFNRGDLQSLREVIVEEVYRCALPRPARTLLDLGANIGLTSLWLSRHACGTSGPVQVLAVEPVADNARMTRLNFRANAVPGDVVQAAAGLEDGEAWFAARAESNLGGLSAQPTGLRVPVLGIRSLLARFPGGRVDLVKMDIEGAEAALLGPDAGWLVQVGALLVEWHDDRADSRPLIARAEAAGFIHRRINAVRQDNLSLLVRPDHFSSEHAGT